MQRGGVGQVTGGRRAGVPRVGVRPAGIGGGVGVGEGLAAEVWRGVALRGRPQALLHRLPGRREKVTQDLSMEEEEERLKHPGHTVPLYDNGRPGRDLRMGCGGRSEHFQGEMDVI